MPPPRPPGIVAAGVGMWRLLGLRRFGALFVTQALGAVNDNLFKNALVVLALYRLAHVGPLVVALAGGIFILPYALFSTLAGQVADKFEKSRVVRFTKWWELGLMLLAAVGFLSGSIVALLLVLFGLGVQAAFFSPVKYGILPDLLSEPELVGGNGLIEAGTFLGILAGTVAGGVLVVLPQGPVLAAGLCILVALAGVVAAYFVPKVAVAAPGLRLEWNIFRATQELVAEARANRPVWLAILGISWFWAMGATVLAELPTVVRDNLSGSGPVVTLLLLVFSAGVGIGSLLCGGLLRGGVAVRLVPWMGLGISVFMLAFAYQAAAAGVLPGVAAVLASSNGRLMLLELLGLAACGGVFSVPLYVVCQEYAEPSHRSRMIAANNILNAAAMVGAALVSAGLFAALRSAPLILAVTAGLNLLVAGILAKLLKNWHS
ncbi:MAG: MFS transporter [Acidocella sp.]|nr:MFS transporter [Acidocella sp.]